MRVAIDLDNESVPGLVHSPSARHGGRVESVHSLRGLAALAVALFHFSWANPLLPPLLETFSRNGWLGVEVFFVISGFILPYSLWRADYRLSLSNFGRFLWKRVTRLEPPYFVTIILILILGYLSSRAPGYRGEPFHLNALQIALHVGYLNAFVGMPWLDPAFWTLAIECQFYLLVALIFPLLVAKKRSTRLVAFGLLLGASLLFTRSQFVMFYLPLFVCGMVAFQRFAGICNRWEAALVLAPAAALLYVHMGAIVVVVGLAAGFVIVAAPSWTNAPLALLGNLSYSIYLLHVPVGGRVINLALRMHQSAAENILSVAVATAVTILAAYILYRLVEKPAQQYAGSLRFTRGLEVDKQS